MCSYFGMSGFYFTCRLLSVLLWFFVGSGWKELYRKHPECVIHSHLNSQKKNLHESPILLFCMCNLPFSSLPFKFPPPCHGELVLSWCILNLGAGGKYSKFKTPENRLPKHAPKKETGLCLVMSKWAMDIHFPYEMTSKGSQHGEGWAPTRKWIIFQSHWFSKAKLLLVSGRALRICIQFLSLRVGEVCWWVFSS